MFARRNFVRVFNSSGLTKEELAQIYGVSRQTLYTWATTDTVVIKDDRIIEVNSHTDKLLNLMKFKVLPLARPMSRRERREAVDRIVKSV